MVENVKGKKNKNKSPVEKKVTINDKKEKCCWKVCLLITSLIIIAISHAGYNVYNKVVEVPATPHLDENFWWGPGDKTDVDTSIRPFRILFTDAMREQFRRKTELYRQITMTRSFKDAAWTYGIHSDALARTFAHWIFQYKFKPRERYFNQYNHFKTNVQGLDIHFVHVKPNVEKNVKVLPILLLHGWPGSIKEFYDVIPLLTTPRPEYDFVFEVIVPSLPGFAYSQAASKQGLGPAQVAVIMRNLMQRLGFQQYFIQGGDFGHTIGSHVATLYPEEVLGFHTNLPMVTSTIGVFRTVLDAVWNGYSLKDNIKFFLEEFGYMHIQGTKPDTIGIALNESPAGLIAYILDRFQIFTDPANKFLEDGGISKDNMTDLIDNVMMYWAPGSITTSMRLYKEVFNNIELEKSLERIPTPVPTWALRLKNELVRQPDSIVRWKYPNLLGSTEHDFGGHFAAFERPKELADDVFKSVQKFLEFKRK